jgi:hypothetical protein
VPATGQKKNRGTIERMVLYLKKLGRDRLKKLMKEQITGI